MQTELDKRIDEFIYSYSKELDKRNQQLTNEHVDSLKRMAKFILEMPEVKAALREKVKERIERIEVYGGLEGHAMDLLYSWDRSES